MSAADVAAIIRGVRDCARILEVLGTRVSPDETKRIGEAARVFMAAVLACEEVDA